MPFFSGTSFDVHPNCPIIERLFSAHLAGEGLLSTRDQDIAVYACRDRRQAEQYTDGDPRKLTVVTPLPGAVLAWSPDHGDLLLGFGSFLKRASWRSRDDASEAGLLSDTMGDLQTIETTLEMSDDGSAPWGAVRRLIADFREECSIVEIDITEGMDILSMIGDHQGEVWITGPCLIEPAEPDFPEP